MVTMTRDQLIAAATEIHDRDGCRCDRRYLMSCTRLANAILRAPKEYAQSPRAETGAETGTEADDRSDTR